ncbi:MAG TPA: hypothetical protein VJ969_01745 [Desulfopila sp.]|nr:hypothetical protein [Desulfopila sp.]
MAKVEAITCGFMQYVKKNDRFAEELMEKENMMAMEEPEEVSGSAEDRESAI